MICLKCPLHQQYTQLPTAYIVVMEREDYMCIELHSQQYIQLLQSRSGQAIDIYLALYSQQCCTERAGYRQIALYRQPCV